MPNENLIPRDTPFKAGDIAPDFTLSDQNRNEWRLSDHVRKSDVVICFYPMDFSSVCSTEMRCITDELAKFTGKGAEVVGISTDSFYAHKAWADSLGLKQTLLADMHRQVCRAFGVYFAPLNVSGRGTVVIGKNPEGIARVKWSQARELKDAMNNADVVAALG